MKIYKVGGAVRDSLLGLAHKDTDYVVTGATESEFLSVFPHAKKVGKSFPVYLADGNEYAFARREQKTGPGHTGFTVIADPSVSLEDDLKRRDLTINAIACDPESGEYIDPCGGIRDLNHKRLIHITDAFAEDPLRVFRVARFAAQLPDFTVAPSTLSLMHSLRGELSSLSPERVWNETEKALAAPAPWRYFEILRDVEGFEPFFPELRALIGLTPGPEEYHPDEADTFDHTMRVLQRLRIRNPYLAFASLCHDIGKSLTPTDILPHHYGHDSAGITLVRSLCDRLRAPAQFRLAGLLGAQYHMTAPLLDSLRPSTAIRMLEKLRKFPGEGIAGYFELVLADSDGRLSHLFDFLANIQSALDIKLPDKYHDMGPASAEILLMLKIRSYKQLVGNETEKRKNSTEF